MKKIVFTGGGTVGHVTLNLLLMPKFIEDGWEVHYIGDKHGITPRNPQVRFGCHFPLHCDWEIASLFLFAKYAGCLQSWLGNCPVALYHVATSPTGSFFKGGLCLSTARYLSACVGSTGLYS